MEDFFKFSGLLRISELYQKIRMAQRLVTLMKSFFQLENRSCFRIPGLQPSMLECLPDEISLMIFKYLDIQELLCCSHVSTKIRRICNDKSLWKMVDLSGRKGNRRKVKAEFIKAILENECENLILRHTQIDGSINLSKISKLKYLNLDITDRDIEVSKPFFNEILLSCCCLQKLVLGEPGDVLDTALLQRIFSQNGQTLEALNFGFTYFDLIFWNASPDVRTLSIRLVQLIVNHCTKLKEINVECCNLHRDGLSQLVSGLSPEIEKVCLPKNEQVTDHHIETLVSRCTKITALDIGLGWVGYCDCSRLTNNAITSILNHLKTTLTELDITGCPYIELEKVLELESLPQLKVLNYGLQEENQDTGLNVPLMHNEMPGLMRKLPHLIINKKVDNKLISVGGGIAKVMEHQEEESRTITGDDIILLAWFFYALLFIILIIFYH